MSLFSELPFKETSGGTLVYNKETKLTETKDTNPKDAIGIKKAGLQCISVPLLFELARHAGGLHRLPMRSVYEMGIAMAEGARKYGRHNYRVSGVRASVYYDAACRHMTQWLCGEELDKDSHICHAAKALGCMAVLADSIHSGLWIDDRPPRLDTLPILAVDDREDSASYFFNVILRDMMNWWEGRDMSHLIRATYNMLKLREAIATGNLVDDRIDKGGCEWLYELKDNMAWLVDTYPDCEEPYTDIKEAEKKRRYPKHHCGICTHCHVCRNVNEPRRREDCEQFSWGDDLPPEDKVIRGLEERKAQMKAGKSLGRVRTMMDEAMCKQCENCSRERTCCLRNDTAKCPHFSGTIDPDIVRGNVTAAQMMQTIKEKAPSLGIAAALAGQTKLVKEIINSKLREEAEAAEHGGFRQRLQEALDEHAKTIQDRVKEIARRHGLPKREKLCPTCMSREYCSVPGPEVTECMDHREA